MSRTVYLIGHGRVDPSIPLIVPPTVTMHWLGPLGEVTRGLSHAFLAGTLRSTSGSSAPATTVDMHYLCGEDRDVDPQHDLKIKNFFNRQVADPQGCSDPWVLYTMARTNVSLKSIFDMLLMLGSRENWHLYWTCCRGFIGQRNPYSRNINATKDGAVQVVRKDPPATQSLTHEGQILTDANFQTIRIVARSDYQALWGQHQIDNAEKLSNPKTAKFVDFSPTTSIVNIFRI